MWQRTVFIGFILFSAKLAVGQSTCDRDAPHNCNFTGRVSSQSCSWTIDTRAWSYDPCSGFDCASFTSSGTGTMKSGTACSTGGDTHCLRIRYLFRDSNRTALSLFVRSNGETTQVWNSTGQGVDIWHTGDIPISSNRKFQVELSAKKENGRLFIDSIEYVRSPCQTSQTTTVPSPSGTVSFSEEKTTTTSRHTSITYPPDTTLLKTEEKPTTSSSKFSTAASRDNEAAGSNDVGVAVGVVVSMIIVAGAVAIFILYRRKQLHLLKTCFRNGNSKKAAGTVRSNRDDKRSLNTGTETHTASGYVNHAVTSTDSQSSHTYYNTVKDIERPDDSTMSQYSTIEKSQSSENKKLPKATQSADQDPYEIKADDGNITRNAPATRNANPNIQGKAGQYQNFPKPAANKDNTQPPSDYSMAKVVGDEATGVYHCLEEEDSYSKGDGEATAVYHYAKDPGVNEAGNADAAGVYHILEEESSAHPPANVYHVSNGSQVKSSKGQTENYNTLDFARKSCGQKESEDASGGVYNHLNDGNDDPYNEVHRERRAAVIDSEYSHIK